MASQKRSLNNKITCFNAEKPMVLVNKRKEIWFDMTTSFSNIDLLFLFSQIIKVKSVLFFCHLDLKVHVLPISKAKSFVSFLSWYTIYLLNSHSNFSLQYYILNHSRKMVRSLNLDPIKKNMLIWSYVMLKLKFLEILIDECCVNLCRVSIRWKHKKKT